MNTRIKKIVIVAAALLFAGSGVSFAHDWNSRDHKPSAKAYGHYKVKKIDYGWKHKQLKSGHRVPQRYVYTHSRNLRHYDTHHRRPAPRNNFTYKVALKDPKLVFKIIVKEHR